MIHGSTLKIKDLRITYISLICRINHMISNHKSFNYLVYTQAVIGTYNNYF
jgi:hypothetical protein